MNKKNIMLILAGIIIQVLEFTVTIGDARIDIFSDIIAYILILVGITGLVERNKLFKKSRSKAIFGLIVAILVQLINLMNFGDVTQSIDTLTRGLTTIFSIYFTYYFTEGIMLESKLQDKSALTRNFRITWAILGVFIFGYYIAFMSNISIASILVEAAVIICAIYYCSTVLNTCKQLYMEGLPARLQK